MQLPYPGGQAELVEGGCGGEAGSVAGRAREVTLGGGGARGAVRAG